MLQCRLCPLCTFVHHHISIKGWRFCKWFNSIHFDTFSPLASLCGHPCLGTHFKRIWANHICLEKEQPGVWKSKSVWRDWKSLVCLVGENKIKESYNSNIQVSQKLICRRGREVICYSILLPQKSYRTTTSG